MRVILTKNNITVSRKESEVSKMIELGWKVVEPKNKKDFKRKK